MKRKILAVSMISAFLAASLLAVGAILMAYRESAKQNRGMALLISNYQQSASLSLRNVSLSTADCARLASDMDDPLKVQRWKAYFKHAAETRACSADKTPDLTELLALYRAREEPDRSSYFLDILRRLSFEMKSGQLSADSATAYLGPPDSAKEEAQGRTLTYKFNVAAQDMVAVIKTTNHTVAAIDLAPAP